MLERDVDHAERRMKLELERIRSKFAHSGIKGASLEEVVREFLRTYLPRRMEVGHGEVIDSHGERSRESDIVIISEDHPRFTRPDTFFIEGVCAVGEVKATLDSRGLRDCIKKGRILRRLKSEMTPDALTITNPSDAQRFDIAPPFFVVAYESKMPLDRIKQMIEEDLQSNGASNIRPVDGVFILGVGCVIDCGDGQGRFRFVYQSMSLPGLIPKPTKRVLFTFLQWLTTVMPRIMHFRPVTTTYLQPSDL